RASGEPAVVCSPMLTPSLEGHARDRSGWRTYKPRREYPHYEGTAIIRPGEYITDQDLESLPDGRVWGVAVERWEKGTHVVPVPSRWALAGEWRFPEIYGDGCEIIVREYESSPTAARQERVATDPRRGKPIAIETGLAGRYRGVRWRRLL